MSFTESQDLPVSFSQALKGAGPHGDDGLHKEQFPSIEDTFPNIDETRKFHTMSKTSLRKKKPHHHKSEEPEHVSDEGTVYDAKDEHHEVEWRASQAPVTETRKPAFTSAYQPGVGRALYTNEGSEDAWIKNASANDHSGKTRDEVERARGMSVLQKHCTFFDRDGDGKIWPHDTVIGMRELGYSWLICLVSVLVIHIGFSLPSQPYYIPDPFFRVRIPTIHKCKHGSDSETFDTEGRFSAQKFEDMFSKYGDGDSLTAMQTIKMMLGNRNVMDFFGWMAIVFEWLSTYLLLWPQDGKMRKEDILGVIDGSIFFRIRDKERQRKTHRKSYFGIWHVENKIEKTT